MVDKLQFMIYANSNPSCVHEGFSNEICNFARLVKATTYERNNTGKGSEGKQPQKRGH